MFFKKNCFFLNEDVKLFHTEKSKKKHDENFLKKKNELFFEFLFVQK